MSSGNPTLEVSAEYGRLFEWIVRGGVTDGLPRSWRASSGAVRRVAGETAALVREYGLPREALESEHLDLPEVWEALSRTCR